MVVLSDVVVGFRKGGDERLHIGLEVRNSDGIKELVGKAVLDQLYSENNGLKPRVDKLYTSLAQLNQVLASHNYEGWSISNNGLVQSKNPIDNKAVYDFNTKLNDFNGFVNRSHQRKRAATQPALQKAHAGWVEKQGGIVKNWKKRYMVLQNWTLHYYETDNVTPEVQPKGSFEAIFVEYTPGSDHGISVFGPVARVFKFRTKDANSCVAWFEAISMQIKAKPNLRERSQSNSALPLTRPRPTTKHASSLPVAAPIPHSAKPPIVQPIRPRNVNTARPRVLRTHSGIQCDGCFANPLRGNRYTSKKKPNFDLCQNCVKSMSFEKSHAPFALVRPAAMVNNNDSSSGVNIEIVVYIDDYDNEDGMYEDEVFAGDFGDLTYDNTQDGGEYEQRYDGNGDLVYTEGGYNQYDDATGNNQENNGGRYDNDYGSDSDYD
ncbi:hypothetical protein THRCLA_11978, partial [Thraustotheca clavata]